MASHAKRVEEAHNELEKANAAKEVLVQELETAKESLKDLAKLRQDLERSEKEVEEVTRELNDIRKKIAAVRGITESFFYHVTHCGL